MTDDFAALPAEAASEPARSFATVGAVYSDGLTLIFDGETAATEKHYKCNAFCRFAAGQRVRIIKDSGTYVVEYPVGRPMTSLFADNAQLLNGKVARDLTVGTASVATRSRGLINAYSDYSGYDIQLYASTASSFMIRRGSGAWQPIQLA